MVAGPVANQTAAQAPAPGEVSAPPVAQAAKPKTLEPFRGVVIHLDPPSVEVSGEACLDFGWLEQIACGVGSREHESLIVVRPKASEIHAALLMAGFVPGRPGSWRYDESVESGYTFEPPRGAKLDLFVRYLGSDGHPREEPIRRWIRDHLGEHTFPDGPWVFGGSQFRENPEWMGPGEHYVADMTGSVVGLVTFGDETIGFGEVLADQEAVQPAEWEVHADRVPPMGTPVTLIIRPYDARGANAGSDSMPSSD